jgi:acyl dehydratase
MTQPSKLKFAELPSMQGQQYVGAPFSLTADDVTAFEHVTWIDRVYDVDPPEFPDDIIEGFHSLALLDALQKMTYRGDPDQCFGFNYGLNRVRFPSQMFVGDRIVPSFEVVSVEPRGGGFLITTACELRVEGSEKPGLVAEWVALVLPRAGFELTE